MGSGYPIGPGEAERLQALRDLRIIGSGPDPVLNQICKLASDLFAVPTAMVSLVGETEQWFKAKVGTEADRTPRDLAFCNHTILSDDVLVVSDAVRDPRFAGNPLVTGSPHIRFYAGAPLSLDGHRLGTLCLVDTKVRRLPSQARSLLGNLAGMASAQLRLHQASVAVEDSEERLRLACEAAETGIWEFNRESNLRRWSPKMLDILGLPHSTRVTPQTFLDRVHPADLDKARHLIATGFEIGRSTETDFRIIRADDGATRWVLITGQIFPGRDGASPRIVGALRDITERETSAQALAETAKRLNVSLQAGGLFIWQHDLVSKEVTRSENAMDVIGLGSTPSGAFLKGVHPDDRPRVEAMLNLEMGTSSSGFRPFDFRYERPDGRKIWLSTRSLRLLDQRYILGTTIDITERKLAEDEIWRTANHDQLTGLPNRALFQRRLDEMLVEAREADAGLNVLFLDLDDFKDVNDSSGHEAGDALLRETADRLRTFLRPCDMVARIGGDEFAIVLAPPYTTDNAEALAQLMLKEVSLPISHEIGPVESRASIGVAGYPDHDLTSANLMKDADIALSQAKARGRNQVVVFSDDLRKVSKQRLSLAKEVRSGLTAQSFVAYYQPKICFRTKAVAGFEALARWRHPTRGVQSPGYFGSAFENPELAYDIGEQVRSQVVSDMKTWLDAGLTIGRVAVNLCSAEFARTDLPDVILDTLKGAGVPTNNFEIEVTETVFLGKTSLKVSDALKVLDRAGISVALDDFGTGFASLTHLKQFPVHSIKIDQSFVRGLGSNEGDEAIVAAVIGLGKNLGMHVTAEGIETDRQAEFLLRHDCDYAQGYLYGRPMPACDVPVFLRDWSALPTARSEAA